MALNANDNVPDANDGHTRVVWHDDKLIGKSTKGSEILSVVVELVCSTSIHHHEAIRTEGKFGSRLGPDMHRINSWRRLLRSHWCLRIWGERATAADFDHLFAGVMGVKFVNGQVLQGGLGDGREE